MGTSNNLSGTYGVSFGESFQFHLLSVAARHPGFVLKFRSVFDHTYFNANVHRLIAKALLAYVDKYKSLPTRPTLEQCVNEFAGSEEVKIVTPIVGKLYEDDLSDSQAVMDRTVEFGQQQAMINAVIAAGDLLTKGDRNIGHLIDHAQTVGADLTNIGIEYRKADRLSWYTGEAAQHRYITTGMSHFDRLLGGGGRRKALYVFLAGGKSFKSTSLSNVLYGGLLAPEGHNVVYVSCELPKEQIAQRFDCRLAGPILHLKKTDPEKYVHALKEREELFMRGRLFIQDYPTRTLTVAGLRSYLTMLKSEGCSVDVLGLDYAGIMKAQSRIGEYRHELAGIFEDLRGIAGEFDCVVWTVAQAKNAALEKETLDMRDFAEATEIGHVMDAGIAIGRTLDEITKSTLRYVLIGSRLDGEYPDLSTVVANLDILRSQIQTTGIYDVSLMRIPTPEDHADDLAKNQIYQFAKNPTVHAGQRVNGNGYHRKPPANQPLRKQISPVVPTKQIAPEAVVMRPSKQITVAKPLNGKQITIAN